MKIDDLLDRPLFAVNGMAMTVLGLTAFVFLYRVTFPHRTPRQALPPLPQADIEAMSVCAAVVFAASAIRYMILAVARAGVIHRTKFEYEFPSLLTDTAIVVACLAAIYFASRAAVGLRIVALWSIVSAAVGLSFYLFLG